MILLDLIVQKCDKCNVTKCNIFSQLSRTDAIDIVSWVNVTNHGKVAAFKITNNEQIN